MVSCNDEQGEVSCQAETSVPPDGLGALTRVARHIYALKISAICLTISKNLLCSRLNSQELG